AIKNNITALKVFLDASIEKRYERIKKREHNTTMELLLLRENSELKRYKEIYGINFKDISIYDLVINTDNKMPEEVAEEVVKFLKTWKN
ncbi:MAG: cytidylate kinase family protein, partial [Thermoplasmata archaeon]